jgi:shikimate dehydrogenase
MFEQAFAHHGLDWRYLTLEIAPENLGDAVRGLRALGFRGGHCADPHKQAVLACLDRATETATMVGAANLIFREGNALVGENTEGKGVVQSIRGRIDLAGKRAVLLGAGRAARAVAIELAAAGVTGITIVNRTESRAGELVALLAGKFEAPASAVPWQGDYMVPPEADLVIQATSMGHDPAQAGLPLVLDSLRPDLLVADLAANSPQGWLLNHAAERGCQTVDGLTMFIEQAAIGFQLWTGVDPSREVLREAVEEFLEL